MSTVIDHINLDLNNDGKTERYDLASGASVHMEDGSTVVINNGNATSYDVHVSNFEYSEEERVVGRWTDGKPIYEKTIIYEGKLLANRYNPIGTINNVDDIISIVASSRNSTNTEFGRYTNATQNSNLDILYTRENSAVVARTLVEWDNPLVKAIIRYTKSTDLPNSFKPSMLNIKSIVPQHNYSTDEKIVGTWIDGKTIYEKTYLIEQSFNNGINQFLILDNIDIISIYNIALYDGKYNHHWYSQMASDVYLNILYGADANGGNGTGIYTEIASAYQNGRITKVRFTIQYLKD